MRTSSSSASAASAPMRRNSWHGPGIGRLTLIDGDCVEPSNCNRQLPALSSTLGQPKALVMAERLRQVNPGLDVQSRIEFIRESDVPELLAGRFRLCGRRHRLAGSQNRLSAWSAAAEVPLISSMGAGGKTDPAQIRIDGISRTYGCALARAVRSRLREHRISRGIKVVFSPEAVPKSAVESGLSPEGKQRSTVGTISYMPACFGCFCAGAVLRGLLQHQ